MKSESIMTRKSAMRRFTAALLLAAFWVYSIVDCALLPPTRHRGVSKPVWILIVVLLPVVGGILWFVVGRGRQRSAPASKAGASATAC